MADLVAQFDATSYVPPEIVGGVNTLVSYYSQAKAAAQTVTVGPHGSVQISDAGAKTVETAIIGAASIILPELGIAYAAFLALQAVLPQAGSGPGVCATDPPLGSAPSQLTAWPNFKSWASFYGPYLPGPADSFEAYANPQLEYNWLLFANCFSNSPSYVPPQAMLAMLISTWNSAHMATSVRTISRSGLNPPGFSSAPNYDPIANALEIDVVAKAMPQGDLTFQQQIDAATNTPHNVTSSFQINDGPPLSLLAQIQADAAAQIAKNKASAATIASTPAKTALGVTAAAAGTVTLTAIVWSLATGKAWDWAFGKAWDEIKDVFDKGGPATFLGELRESNPVGERSGSATQTLLFSRRKYTTASAKAWARAHGYHSGKVDVTSNYVRLRQQDPGKFSRLRTVPFSKDIKAVIGFKR